MSNSLSKSPPKSPLKSPYPPRSPSHVKSPSPSRSPSVPGSPTPQGAPSPAPGATPPLGDDYPAIEVHDGEIDEGEFEPSDYDSASSIGSTTSITSNVYHHESLNGRRYQIYRHGSYPFPNDGTEQSREDLQHALFLEILDGALFLAPIGDNPHKILDLGTGTGSWAIAVADENPSAEVIGIDLSPIQPIWVPPNCQFLVDDIEDTWLHGKNFDLIHMRIVTPLLHNPGRVIANSFKNLRPGGWIESQDFGEVILCDDNTLPPDAACHRYNELGTKGMAKFGMNLQQGSNLGELLETAGFENISCKCFKIPIGTWAKDPHLRLCGMYMYMIMDGFLPILAAKPFRAVEPPLNDVEIELFVAQVRRELKDRNMHTYMKWYVWMGQKPESKP